MKLFLRVLCALFVLVSVAQADQLVASVQKKLSNLGFYSGTVDGEMGSQTAAAIRRYQLAENLNVTGQLNPQTLKSLGLSMPAVKEVPPPSSRPSSRPPQQQPPPPAPVPEYVAIANVFKGGPYITAPPEVQISTIRQAQKTLKLLGYYGGPVNGSPTPAFVNGLKAWQQSAGFRQTGRFDESTLKGLNIMAN